MKIKVKLNPNANMNELESGSISEVSWQTLKPFLEQAFRKKSKEYLEGLTVTEYGIKAKFESIKKQEDE